MYLALYAILTRAILERLTSRKFMFEWCLCMYVLLHFCVWVNFVDLAWESVCIYLRSFLMCIWLWHCLVVLRSPCTLRRTLKSSYQPTSVQANFWNRTNLERKLRSLKVVWSTIAQTAVSCNDRKSRLTFIIFTVSKPKNKQQTKNKTKNKKLNWNFFLLHNRPARWPAGLTLIITESHIFIGVPNHNIHSVFLCWQITAMQRGVDGSSQDQQGASLQVASIIIIITDLVTGAETCWLLIESWQVSVT